MLFIFMEKPFKLIGYMLWALFSRRDFLHPPSQSELLSLSIWIFAETSDCLQRCFRCELRHGFDYDFQYKRTSHCKALLYRKRKSRPSRITSSCAHL